MLSKTKKKNKFPEYFSDSEQLIKDKVTIANRFNHHCFTNIGPELASRINPSPREYKQYLHKTQNKLFKFKDIDEETVQKVIDHL